MKSGNINRPENLGCAPLTPKMCLSSLKQYLVRQRADSTRKRVSQQHWEQSTDGGGRFSLFCLLSYLFPCGFWFGLKLTGVQSTKNTPHQTKRSSKYSHLRRESKNVWLLSWETHLMIDDQQLQSDSLSNFSCFSSKLLWNCHPYFGPNY